MVESLAIKEGKEDVRISGREQTWLIRPWSCSAPAGAADRNAANKATRLANVAEYFLSVSKPAAPWASRVTSDHSPAPSALSNLSQPCHMTSLFCTRYPGVPGRRFSGLVLTLDLADLRWRAGCVAMQKRWNHTNSTAEESKISAPLLQSSTNTCAV